MMRFLLTLVAAMTLWVFPATAQQGGPLRLEITEGVIEPLPVAVPDFVADTPAAQDYARNIARVIAADEEPTPTLFVRVSLGGIGLRVVSLPSGSGAWGAAPQRGADAADGPAYLVALDFDLPGIIATF